MKKHFLYLALAALITATACKDKKHTIRIATKPMTEQFILGEMLALLIEENTDYDVKLSKSIEGGTGNIHPAVLKGEYDLYPEYTGTGWIVVLKEDTIPSAGRMFDYLKKIYHEKYGLKWLPPYGFNNSYGLALFREKADKYGLKTYSDLTRYPDLFIFGAEYDFYEIPQGYDELCDTYGLKFKKTVDMDIGLKYEAIRSGKIDIMNIFTTDGQLSGADLTILKDDKHFFPAYYCATVIREDCLNEHPGLEQALLKMTGILTDTEMSQLNYQVDAVKRPEREVAMEFLTKKGLLNKHLAYEK